MASCSIARDIDSATNIQAETTDLESSEDIELNEAQDYIKCRNPNVNRLLFEESQQCKLLLKIWI